MRCPRLSRPDATPARERIEAVLARSGNTPAALASATGALDSIAHLDRAALIQQSVDKEMRDLVAKHDPAALAALIARDQPVKLSLGAIIQALEQRGSLSPDAEVLKRALLHID